MVILGPSDAKICLVTISIDLYHHLGSGVGNIWQLQLLKEQVNKQKTKLRVAWTYIHYQM